MASSKYMRQNTPSDNPNMALSKYAEINFKSSTGLNEVILEDESQGDDSNLLSPNNKNSIKTPFSVKTQVRMMSPTMPFYSESPSHNQFMYSNKEMFNIQRKGQGRNMHESKFLIIFFKIKHVML